MAEVGGGGGGGGVAVRREGVWGNDLTVVEGLSYFLCWGSNLGFSSGESRGCRGRGYSHFKCLHI